MSNHCYSIPAQLMQAIVSKLAAAPWGQVNEVMSPLLQEVTAQDAAFAAQAQPLQASAELAQATQ